MAEIIYPSAAEYAGPWLIEFSQLLQLDAAVDEIFKKMQDVSEPALEEELRKVETEYSTPESKARAQNRLKDEYKPKRRLTVYLDSGKRVLGENFQEIAKEPVIQSEVCRGFSLNLSARKAECELRLEHRYGDNKLQYSVKPATDSVTKDIIYDLETWIASTRPAHWLKLWKTLRDYIWIAYLPALMILFLLTFSSPREAYKNELKSQAHELLEDGITPEETGKALEVLLKLNTDYLPQTHRDKAVFAWQTFLIYAAAWTLLIFIVSLFPKNVLGLGEGTRVIKRWRLWMRIVTVTVPVGIVLPILLNKISTLF